MQGVNSNNYKNILENLVDSNSFKEDDISYIKSFINVK